MTESDFNQPLDVGQAMRKSMQENHLNARYAEVQKKVFADSDIQAFFTAHADELNRDIVQRDFANLYEFYTQKQKSDDESVHRGYEPVLDFIDGQITVLYQPSRATVQAQKQQARENLVHAIQMPKLITRATMDDFSSISADQSKAVTKIISFITEYLESPTEYHRGLYLHGPYGVGKTHLMGAMANELAEYDVPVTLVHFPSFAVELRNGFNSDNEVNQKRLETLQKATILVLDDIGAESLTAWLRDDVLGVILEYRMQNELPTFFTSNFSMDQLEKEHLGTTKAGNEPMKAARIMQRIRFLSEEVLMSGENKRVQ
ncbi:primosomal protein DnaI [Weissella viridescens]|uniref:primosomal protein DnaI n=1 Tax=Weissella viridescens TaxID=1629 RepID=UPI001D0626B0|nr:primosomal protein DnaI [Weissella viridescens]MCB6839558.1 primosomal protein DnaI [Weissella viridescens]MCB6846289.1 primosomal protein DnaI [Weissella viridescens]